MPGRTLLWALLASAALAAMLYTLISHYHIGFATLAAYQMDLRAWVVRAPVLSAVAYVVAYALAVGASLPLGGLLTIAGGLLFGVALGAALAVAGATAGATLLFLLARSVFAPALAGLLGRRVGPFLDRIRPGLQRDGFSYLLALRLLPVVPFWAGNLAPALLGMRLAPFAGATVLGIIPATTVLAAIGASLGDVLAAGGSPDLSVLRSPPVLLPLVGLAALSLAPVAWRRWRRQRG